MKEKLQTLHEKLEVLIITYNRGKYLENTLTQFLKSPFNKCKITILDNCSTDDTPSVCRKYKKQFSNFNILRHKKNIGGGANYLRAAEICEAEYSWIVCDDDDYDFSDCEDVIAVIENGSHDVISVGNSTYKFTRRGITDTAGKLVESGEMYYTIHAFIPSLIFRTEHFNQECLIKGHLMQKDMFPQLYFVHRTVIRDLKVYISRNEILKIIPGNTVVNLNPFFQFSSWVASCMIIEDRATRRRAIYEYTHNRKSLFVMKLMYYVYYDKVLLTQGRMSFGKEGLFPKFMVLFSAFTGSQFIILMGLLPVFITPAVVFKYLGKAALFIYYKGKIPTDKDPLAKIDPRL